MSFRRKMNRHDAWQQSLETNRTLLEATELPAAVFADEDRFVEFLNTGTFNNPFDGTTVRLAELTDDEFLRLERAVNQLIDSLFFAFDQERFRRFKRYG